MPLDPAEDGWGSSFVDWDADIIPLLTVFLGLTHNCNLRCRHCFVNAPRAGVDMSTSEVLTAIDTLAGLRPARLVMTGGEPLTRSDFAEIAAHAASLVGRGIGFLKLATNGTLVAKSDAARIAGQFDQVDISVDGFEPEHDALRGRGSYEATLKGMDLLAAASARIRVSITITALNSTQIPDLIGFLSARFGVARFGLRTLWLQGRALEVPDLRPSPSQLQNLCRAVSLSSRFRAEVPALDHSPHRCVAGYTISVEPDGRVFPCVFMAAGGSPIGLAYDPAVVRAYLNSSTYAELRSSLGHCVLDAGGVPQCSARRHGSREGATFHAEGDLVPGAGDSQ